jgi:hypothetical protein
MLDNCIKYLNETIDSLKMIIKSYEQKQPAGDRIIYMLNNIIHKQEQIKTVLNEIKKVIG